MNKSGKIRITVFIVMLFILSYFSVGYTYEIFSFSLKDYFIDTDSIKNVNIDGADFTMIFRLMGSGMNSVLGMFTYGLYAIVILIVSLIFVIPLRFIGLRKNVRVTSQEIELTKWSFIGVLTVSIIIGLILTKGTVIIPLLIYTAIWGMDIFLIYVLSIIKHNVV